MRIINKTGLKLDKYELMETLRDLIVEDEYLGNVVKNFYSTKFDYNFSNNGNTWTRATIDFRKLKSGNWVVER